MKNRITPLLVIIIIALSAQISLSQDVYNNYKGEKAGFYKLYREYLTDLEQNKTAVKPVDPGGLFYIDEKNNFRSRSDNGAINVTDNILPGTNQSDAVNIYTWAQTSGTYTAIAGTTLGTSSNDDEIYGSIPIGFTFNYNGTAYTTVGISTNGYIKFGATPTTTYTNVLSAQTNMFAGFNTDFLGNGTTSNLSYITTGSAPNRKFIIQWTSWGLYNGTADGSDISYQMVLNETSNQIQLIFGPMTIVLTTYTPQCGINSTTSDFNIRTTTTNWAATTTGASNTSNCALTNTIKPASGQTWTWGPPPLCGTYTIPGSYATVAAAISDLNSLGVCGTSPVIFNIAAGYTETIPAGGYTINITGGQPTAAGPVIFQRNGAGSNPILSSNTATGSGLISGASVGVNGDAFIKIVGTDYISFKNIDLTENYTGASAVERMEYGFLFVRGSSTDGCKNDTLSGCVINMQRINLVSCGISSLNINAAGTTTSPTTTDGRHENINIQGCTVNNTLVGMYFAGYAASTPYDLYDHSYKIGTITGNTLTNIGSGGGAVTTSTLYGIYAIYQDSMKILNNTINVSTGLNNQTHYGIFTSTGTNSSVDITNNTVCDTADGTVVSSSQQAAIYNTFGASGTDNIVNITNNTVRWCRYFNTSSSTVYYIANLGAAFIQNITGNTVDSNTVGGQSFSTATSTQYGIYVSASNTDVNSVTNISGNTVRNLTRTQSVAGTGTCYGLYIRSCCMTEKEFNKSAYNFYNATTTSTLAGIYCFPSANTLNVYGNTVRDLRKLEGATTAPIYALYWSQSTPIQNCYNNQVYNIYNYSTTATGVIYGIYNFGSPPNVGGYESVYGNSVHDVTHFGTTVATGLFFVGIYDGAGTTGGCDKSFHDNTVYNVTTNYGQTGGLYFNYADTAYIYNNRVYNLRNTTGVGNTPQTYGILMTNTVLTSVYNVYNNYVSELYADANPTFPGVLGIWQNNTSAGKYYYNTIYLDGTSTGTNFGTMGLYLAGATTQADLRNNIIINKSIYTGTGGTIALYRGESGLTYYDALSNNNNLYAGTPSASNLIYLDLVNSSQTISDFKTLMAPRDNNSFSENSPLLNTTTHPYNLHMSTVIPTYCESGGTPITSPFPVTTDYDGNTRNVTTPDVGADEFAGIIPPPPVAIVNLTVIPGGFYNSGNGRLNMRDTIKVYLVDSASCTKVDSAKGVLDSVTFSTSISFSNANTGDYYMMVYHRNHLAVATRFKTTVTRGATVGYDFTTDSAKAFGFNMVKVSTSPVKWGLIPSDANRDGFVDGLDQTIWIAQNGLDGYLPSDFNGDSFIDGLDQTLWVLYNGNSSFLPCGFTLDPVTNLIIINTPDYDAKKSNKIIFDRKKQEAPVQNYKTQKNNRK